MNSKALSSVLNYRIVIILIETILIYFLYDKYRIDIKIDFTIMSIAIVFPLVFSITSAYQRRQEAIALFSEFRNKIIDLTNIFYAVDEVNKKDYVSLLNKLVGVQTDLNNYLINTSSDNDFDVIREKRKEVLLFLDSHKKLFNEREKDSIIRVKNELFLSAEKIRGIKIHGTPNFIKKILFDFYLLFTIFIQLSINCNKFWNRISIRINSFFNVLFGCKFCFNGSL